MQSHLHTCVHRLRRLTRGLWAGTCFADTFGNGLDTAFGQMSAFLALALVAADEDGGLSHLDAVPYNVRLHPLSVHTTYAFYVGGVLHAEAKAHVAHWEQTVARLQGGGQPMSPCRDVSMSPAAPEAPGAALLKAVEGPSDKRLQAGISLLSASAKPRVLADFEKARKCWAKVGERHSAAFAFPSLSAARRTLQSGNGTRL